MKRPRPEDACPDWETRAKKQLMRRVRISESGCWEWQHKLDKDGYGVPQRVYYENWRPHRLAWAVWFGDPGGAWVLHECDNRRCVNPMHLFLGDASDNNRDRSRKGRNHDQAGMKNAYAKLTPEAVVAIRKSKLSCKKEGEKWGVSPSTVNCVRLGRTWGHV